MVTLKPSIIDDDNENDANLIICSINAPLLWFGRNKQCIIMCWMLIHHIKFNSMYQPAHSFQFNYVLFVFFLYFVWIVSCINTNVCTFTSISSNTYINCHVSNANRNKHIFRAIILYFFFYWLLINYSTCEFSVGTYCMPYVCYPLSKMANKFITHVF